MSLFATRMDTYHAYTHGYFDGSTGTDKRDNVHVMQGSFVDRSID